MKLAIVIEAYTPVDYFAHIGRREDSDTVAGCAGIAQHMQSHGRSYTLSPGFGGRCNAKDTRHASMKEQRSNGYRRGA